MANALTDLASTVYADTFLQTFRADLQPFNTFTRDFSPTAAQRGDRVKVPFVPAQDAAADFGTSGYIMQDADASGKDILLNKHKFVSFKLSDVELAERSQVSAEMFFQQKAHQLAKAVIQDVLGLVTLANFGSAAFTGAASAFDGDSVVEIKDALDDLDVPTEMRSLVLSPAYFNALLNDASGIREAYAYGSSDAIRDGRIPNLLGFNMYASNVVPDNSQNLTGFAAYPDAIGIAMRYLEPQPGHDYAEAQAITDPQGSGLTIGYRKWYDRDMGEMRHVYEAFYGSLLMNGSSLVRVISAV